MRLLPVLQTVIYARIASIAIRGCLSIGLLIVKRIAEGEPLTIHRKPIGKGLKDGRMRLEILLGFDDPLASLHSMSQCILLAAFRPNQGLLQRGGDLIQFGVFSFGHRG